MPAGDTVVDAKADASLPRRPDVSLSVAVDAVLGVAIYLLTYWLRFSSEQLAAFLPGARATLLFVIVGQLTGMAVVGAYVRRPRIDWLVRVVLGIAIGTLVAGAFLAWTAQLEGVSRSAFLADAILFSITSLGWRGVWGLRLRARARTDLRLADGDLADRSGEMATLSAAVSNLYRYRELLKNLVLKDIKLKYRGSVLGFVWSLANPLLMMVVYTVAFTVILRIRSASFVYSLMLGLLSWTLFSSSAAMSTGAIIDNAGLLKSVLFPRAILPIGTVLFNLSQYLLTILVFLPLMMFWYRVPPSPALAVFPLLLALQVVFTMGAALILATATAFFRDVRHLLEVALAMLFWTTPIVYGIEQVPERLRLLILLSPVSSFVVGYQEILIHRSWPDLTLWLIATVYALGTFFVGALLFVAFEDRFMEQL